MAIMRRLLMSGEGPALLEGACGIGVLAWVMSLSKLSLHSLG